MLDAFAFFARRISVTRGSVSWPISFTLTQLSFVPAPSPD